MRIYILFLVLVLIFGCAAQEQKTEGRQADLPSAPTAQPLPVPQPSPTPQPLPSPEPVPTPTSEPSPVPAPQPQPEPQPLPGPAPIPLPLPEPTPKLKECIESDSGYDIYKKGTVSDGSITKEDYCLNSTIGTEFFCSKNKIASVTLECPVNYECNEGMCILTKSDSSCILNPNIISYKDNILGTSYVVYTTHNSQIRLVCQEPCPLTETLMKRQYTSLEKAINNLTQIAGIEFWNKIRPIDAHFTSDKICGTYREGMTGFAKVAENGKGVICMFSYEKTDSLVPFNEDNACRIVSNLLNVHEAGHHLFRNTSVSYWPQEYFVKMLSFHISGYYEGGVISKDSSFTSGISACDEKMEHLATLPYNLCKLYGLDVKSYSQIFREMELKRDSGILVDDKTFKLIIDNVVKQDTQQAFLNSNITIPN